MLYLKTKKMIMSEKQTSRSTVRLLGYDYSQAGLYFITICTKDKQSMFGYIANGDMELNDNGLIVHDCWLEIPNHYPQTFLHDFVVMPNHMHGIIEICNDDPMLSVVAKSELDHFRANGDLPLQENLQKRLRTKNDDLRL